LRAVVLRGFAAERFAGAFVAADDAVFGFAALLRVERAPAVFAALLRAVALRAGDFRAVVLRAAVFRADDLRAALFRAVDLRGFAAVDELGEPAMSDHLPDIMRCAASATASAISEPSLDALEATLLAACCAVSAASRPASRIARRAFGLAAIAAAAAVRPAASISLLIAAFAILSTVVFLDLDVVEEDLAVDDLEELLRAAFAIVISPSCPVKDN
jgi:hypothetical protein